jgi:UDP-N-acetylmuramoyl-tripeptide--D-alanyl-D-alanine ligase
VKHNSTYGFRTSGVTVKGTVIRFDHNACAEVEVKPKGSKAFMVKLGVPGEHNAMNSLAAAAVGLGFKVPVAKIQKALKSFKAVSKRMQVLHFGGFTVINDTYNANPDSVLAALRTLGSTETAGKRIAVLGDMFELGDQSEAGHRSVGHEAGEVGVEYLLTHGKNAKLIHDAAAVKFKAHYDQKNILVEYLSELLTAGDVVLVKGSRGMKMEDVVTFLQERFRAR